MRPTACQSQVALPEPLEMPDCGPGAAGGTTGPVRGMVAMFARPLEEVGVGGERGIADGGCGAQNRLDPRQY